MVMAFDCQSRVLHGHSHLAAQVLIMVRGWNGKISFPVARPIPEVLLRPPRVPPPLLRIDEVEPVLLPLIEADAVKNEELRLGAEIRRVGHARSAQIELRLPRDIPWVPVISLLGHRIDYIRDH